MLFPQKHAMYHPIRLIYHNTTMTKRILSYFHCSKLKFVFLKGKLANLLQIVFHNRLIKNEVLGSKIISINI